MTTSLDTCPWCGAEQKDLWDYDWGGRYEILTECTTCEKPVAICRSVDVSYAIFRYTPDPSEGEKP